MRVLGVSILRIALATLATFVGLSFVAESADAQGRRVQREVESTGSLGRAPWSQPWEYDTGGDNDARPELPYYMQGRGQQTGGTARNLLPCDGFTITRRC